MKFAFYLLKILKSVIIVIIFFQFSNVFSQKIATTDTGEEVILNKNGTWKYAEIDDIDVSKVDTNSIIFKKDVDATFLLKSKKTNCGIYMNPKKWKFKKSIVNEDFEYQFENFDKSAYAVVVNEKVELPLQTLIKFALRNARKASQGTVEIEEKEYRIVNDKVILCITMKGKIQGINYNYIAYFFTSENGTTQLMTYTSQKLLASVTSQMEELLNGLTFAQ